MNGLNKTSFINSGLKSKSKKQKKTNSFIGKPYNISFNAAITEPALQSTYKLNIEINNRLKVSSIVYKDSKLRHVRH